jgi:ABC-type Fe3+-hydroxamate transport system substrate-binding protein
MILENTSQLNVEPKRIISLVPSQTSLLHALGLGERVIGITKFCTEPNSWRLDKSIVGGTKNPTIDKIKNLRPDLIIANREENRKEDVEKMAEEFPVWVTDVNDLPSALNMIQDLGELTGHKTEATDLVKKIAAGFEQLSHKVSQRKLPAAYLIWKDPWMSIGGDTFIHDMMHRAGLENLFGDLNRYPVIDINLLREKKCPLLLLSSEPYPFSKKHLSELSKLLPHCRIELVDGMKFSWYGDQLLHTPEYLTDFLRLIGHL